MTKAEIKQNLGKFGQITAINSRGYSKTFSGRMKRIDTINQVLCEDNEGILSLYKHDKIQFEEKEFTPLPSRVRGRKYVNLGGKFIYEDTKREVDFKK